ncbi:MAG: hypothetical protein JWO36_1002 [Myxococcales bacterium]|nr:hypothetical protein [Myxococcales bacterium]
MYVGIAKISLVIGDSHSLKEKRMVLRRIKDRVRERIGVMVNEVGEPEILDNWQRAELGVAVVSGERHKALELLDSVVRVAMSAGGAEIVAIAKDVTTFDAPPAPVAMVDDRTGAGDKAAGSDDWIPDEWREEAKS